MTAGELWIDRSTLRTITELSFRSIERKSLSGQLKSRPSQKRSANGKAEREYSSLSLTPQQQLKLAALNLSLPEAALAVTSANEAQGKLDLPATLHHLTPEQDAELQRRRRLIAPMIAFSERRLPKVRLRDGREVCSLDDVAEWIAGQTQDSKSTVWRLYSRYVAGGDIALEPKARADRGRSRSFDNRPELQQFVIAKWEEIGNIAAVSDFVSREWGGPLLPYNHGATPPCRDAIGAFIKSIPQSVRDAARGTKQKWESKHAPYIVTLRGKHTRPNQVWIADHRIYDVLVMNDRFPQEQQGVAIRLWETCIQDMRTRLIVGSVWSAAPSWRTIASALRKAITAFGIPELFYCDNGKDFRKVGAGAKRGSLLTASDSSARVELDEHGRVFFPVNTPDEMTAANRAVDDPQASGLLARL
jgi:putative transposase